MSCVQNCMGSSCAVCAPANRWFVALTVSVLYHHALSALSPCTITMHYHHALSAAWLDASWLQWLSVSQAAWGLTCFRELAPSSVLETLQSSAKLSCSRANRPQVAGTKQFPCKHCLWAMTKGHDACQNETMQPGQTNTKIWRPVHVYG